ncbi:hypothetical protein BTN49_1852 [Candidatus Enterovibrio escicola]|uniref:Uncharacterized protein n=1 Tax=Candidatus Enterovibrio escicola TaxID=1927127 RepID=A0A2A5T396_9GAMM|nr:hypothetical protein BTN49_1852 [Candidatus Enterovibrio escacola]
MRTRFFIFNLIVAVHLNFVGSAMMGKIFLARPAIMSVMPYIPVNHAFTEHHFML